MHVILTTAPYVVDSSILSFTEEETKAPAINDLTKDTQLESGGGGIRTYIFWLQNLLPSPCCLMLPYKILPRYFSPHCTVKPPPLLLFSILVCLATPACKLQEGRDLSSLLTAVSLAFFLPGTSMSYY